jgi:Peptidase A4 family
MLSFVVRKRPTQPRVWLYLEELERRALPSAVQPLPIFDTVYSSNWSGYAAETNLNAPAANAVTRVSGSWTVPTVTGNTNAYSSVWVGIDGYSSALVEQLGTEQDTSKSGAATYYAWWEMYPNPSVTISSMTISPGDRISASVTYGSGAFTLQITDNTTGKSFSTTQSATAQRSSAEWIVEAPSSFSGVLPLANFGTATISAAQATINGTTGAIDNGSWQNTSIDMVSRSGTVIDQTSGLTDTNTAPITSSFSVTYTGSGGGHGHGHGHGPIQTVELVVPPTQPDFQAPATPQALAKPAAELPAAAAGQDFIVSAPAADALFAQVHERGSTSALKTSGALPSDITDEALRADILGSDEFYQSW